MIATISFSLVRSVLSFTCSLEIIYPYSVRIVVSPLAQVCDKVHLRLFFLGNNIIIVYRSLIYVKRKTVCQICLLTVHVLFYLAERELLVIRDINCFIAYLRKTLL